MLWIFISGQINIGEPHTERESSLKQHQPICCRCSTGATSLQGESHLEADRCAQSSQHKWGNQHKAKDMLSLTAAYISIISLTVCKIIHQHLTAYRVTNTKLLPFSWIGAKHRFKMCCCPTELDNYRKYTSNTEQTFTEDTSHQTWPDPSPKTPCWNLIHLD